MNSTLQKYIPLITSLVTLVVYFITMSRGVMPIDAGELAASQYTLGVSHPSGYPLFNLIGFLWSKLPLGSVIFRLNLLCAIWVAFANFFMVKTAFIVLKNSFIIQQPAKKQGAKTNSTTTPSVPSVFLQLMASVSGILILAFCTTWWIQSAGVEVYSLQMALLAVFFFVFIKTYFKSAPSYKDWLISGLFLGLCFTNHLTAVLVLPGVVVLYFIKMKFTKQAFLSGLVLTAAGAVVFFALYGFMMYRAGASPKVNWGNPENMEYLKRHVSGWQFGVFMEKDPNKTNSNIALFFKTFTNESAILGLLLFLAGMVYAFMKNNKMAIFWILNLVASLFYISKYNIHDIGNYFLLGYMSAAIFIVFGLYWILSSMKQVRSLAFVVLALPLLPLILNWNTANQSKRHYIDEYSIAALNSVDRNAIILSREWDVFVSPAYYYHLVEKMRPDVLILDKELLRRSWYYNQIKAWDPNFAAKIEKQANEFKEVVLPFEREQTKDGSKIQPKFEAYITAILSEYTNRPVYVSSFVLDADIASGGDVKLPPGTFLIPEAYFFRVSAIDTSNYHPLPRPLEYNVNFSHSEEDKKYESMILNFSMNVLSSRVGYEMGFGRKAEARKIMEIIQGIDPSIPMPEGL